jgi:hypothetical protein
MADQSIACPSCGKKIPLTRALRDDIEASLKAEFDQRLEDVRERAKADADKAAAKRHAQDLRELQDQLKDQAKALDDARQVELSLRKRELALERQQADVELTVARAIADARATLVTEIEERAAEQHRLKDTEKDRQHADMRRQIEDLKRRADQGSQQLQGEAGEEALESILRSAFPADDISGIGQGIRGADIHQVIVDSRGARSGSILWECKNARNWSDAWITKLKNDQRSLHADVAVIVTAALPKECRRFAMIDGVLVTDFACAAALAAVLRSNLLALAQARSAALRKHDTLELLYRYLSGVEFRQRVEAVVDSFAKMREELEQERRAAERTFARRAKQIDAVTFNVSGMYGDLQGMVPSLPDLRALNPPAEDAA